MSDPKGVDVAFKPIIAIPAAIATKVVVRKLEKGGYLVVVVPTVADLDSVKVLQPHGIPLGGDISKIVGRAILANSSNTYAVRGSIGTEVAKLLAGQEGGTDGR